MDTIQRSQTLYQTERLIFRAIEDDDADARFIGQCIRNDPANFILSDISMPHPQSRDATKANIAGIKKSLLAVMICLPPAASDAGATTTAASYAEQMAATPGPTPIGYLAVIGGATQHQQHARAKLGITIAAAYQGRGYGGEALNWAVDWAFRHARMHSVQLEATSLNERAIRLYQVLGFSVDGRHRESWYYDRKWYDTVVLSMLEGEWEELRREKK